MRNLECVLVEYRKEFLWCVFERATEQVIRSFYFEEDALEYIKFLESGGAFEGFTPAFMLIDFKAPKGDMNEDFNQQFA